MSLFGDHGGRKSRGMTDTGGPTRSDRDRLRGHRAEKPYDRAQQRPQLRRSASIVDSLKSIVTKPFSWLISGSAEHPISLLEPSENPSQPSRHLMANGISKRRASNSDTYDTQSTPKKPRHASPNSSAPVTQALDAQLKASASVPVLASQSAALRMPRGSFLSPLPRTSTPSRHNSLEPSRMASSAVRASSSIGSAVFSRRAGSLTPQASFDNGADRTAFGLRYRSPFMPMLSPVPTSAAVDASSASRQSSAMSERDQSVLKLPKPRTTLAVDDGETEREQSSSPTRPSFTPIGSPTRRLSDSVTNQLVTPFQLATIRRAESLSLNPADVHRNTPSVQIVRHASA